ncbi:hypothetical protein BDV12DRAFT_207224 [Aspergillus spectabilis]
MLFPLSPHLLPLLLTALTFLLPLSLSHPTPNRRAQDPSTDPFYIPPSGFESTSPGTILRQRRVITSFFGLIPDPVESWQLLYRTTAINGSAIATATTIFKPLFPKRDRFISFHTAYDSSSVSCNPSYQYLLGTVQTDLISSVEFLIIQVYLLQGYIISSPDYEGPDAAFGPGHLEGMGVLDSMRAVSNFKSTLGLSTNTPAIVGTGYSGGAIATGWAAALQPSYAPELDVKGWVAGGTPANLTGTLLFIDDTTFSGFIPAAIDGLSKPSAYGAELGPVIDSIITEKGQSILDFANENCAVSDLLNFLGGSIFSTDIQTLGTGLLTEPTIQAILKENVLGAKQSETPSAPIFVYHATQDEIIPYSNATAMVDSWCSNGADVTFTTYGNGGHATTEIIGLPDVVGFVESAFKESVKSGCSSNEKLTSVLNPIALGVELEPILVALVEALGKIGAEDVNVKSDVKVLEVSVS